MTLEPETDVVATVGGRTLGNHRGWSKPSGYHNLAAAIIADGMGRYSEVVKNKKVVFFKTPNWILTKCGRFYAGIVGLDPAYLYLHAGGKGPADEIRTCGRWTHRR